MTYISNGSQKNIDHPNNKLIQKHVVMFLKCLRHATIVGANTTTNTKNSAISAIPGKTLVYCALLSGEPVIIVAPQSALAPTTAIIIPSASQYVTGDETIFVVPWSGIGQLCWSPTLATGMLLIIVVGDPGPIITPL